MTARALLAAALLSAPFLAAPAAMAQTPTAPPADQEGMMRMMHLAARNQLGVLEYCVSQKAIEPAVVDLQKKMLTMLPPTKVDGLDAAEAAGKRGVVQFGGQEVVITDAAQKQGTTPDAMCKQMGAMLQAQAANLPK